MVRVSSATSGEELLSLDAAEFDAMVRGYGSTVGSLKRHLAERHFEKRYSRFQLRFLREGAPDELLDDENIMLPMDLRLMVLKHLPADRDRDRLFLRSCEDGDGGGVEACLNALQNPNVRDGLGSALEKAIQQGQGRVVYQLLEAKADTESRATDGLGRRPLHHAALRGDLEVVGRLLDYSAHADAADSMGRRPLHWAALQGHVDVARLLIERGAKTEAWVAILILTSSWEPFTHFASTLLSLSGSLVPDI